MLTPFLFCCSLRHRRYWETAEVAHRYSHLPRRGRVEAHFSQKVPSSTKVSNPGRAVEACTGWGQNFALLRRNHDVKEAFYLQSPRPTHFEQKGFPVSGDLFDSFNIDWLMCYSLSENRTLWQSEVTLLRSFDCIPIFWDIDLTVCMWAC